MIRESLNERILKKCLRAEFRLKQGIEYLRWEYETLNPRLDEFLKRATIPNAPDETIIEVVLGEGEWAQEQEKVKKPRANRRKA